MKTRSHPKNSKKCVFCENWIGDADLQFISVAAGYSYEGSERGTCTKNGATLVANTICPRTKDYIPNLEARRLL